MRNLLDSLSLWSGAVLAASLSATVVALLETLRMRLRGRLWIEIAIVPLTVAYCLDWSPVWLGGDVTEYSAWAFVTIVPWFLAGLVSSAAVVYTAQKWRTR